MKEQAIEFGQEFFEDGEFVINGSELFDKTDTFFAVDDDRIVGIIELQINNGRKSRCQNKN